MGISRYVMRGVGGGAGIPAFLLGGLGVAGIALTGAVTVPFPAVHGNGSIGVPSYSISGAVAVPFPFVIAQGMKDPLLIDGAFLMTGYRRQSR